MGLFSNKKKLCPICGNPTPRMFPDEVDGTAICKECSKKADLPKEIRDGMSLEDFRRYAAFYRENFQINCTGWDDDLSLDTEHGLFRLRARAGPGRLPLPRL